jgi:hypothetical protein
MSNLNQTYKPARPVEVVETIKWLRDALVREATKVELKPKDIRAILTAIDDPRHPRG